MTTLLAYSTALFIASWIGGWLPRRYALTNVQTQLVLSLVAGLMLGVASLHLIPHSVELGQCQCWSQWLLQMNRGVHDLQTSTCHMGQVQPHRQSHHHADDPARGDHQRRTFCSSDVVKCGAHAAFKAVIAFRWIGDVVVGPCGE